MSINEKTWQFVREHADEDVRKVALLGTRDPEVDLQMALQQIAGIQTARKKLPSWAKVEGIIYPPHLNMEQCSSERTAKYKGGLIRSLSPKGDRCSMMGDAVRFVDLTGGFGVDFYWMAKAFTHHPSPTTHRLIYLEQNETLCAIAESNFRLLGLDCSVCCCDTTTYLADMPHADLVYMDPARRNEHGGRTYGIEDCTPNVLELLPQLMAKTDRLMLKLSPMLDWRKAVDDIQKPKANSQQPIASVIEIHIVSVDNECKELLLVISKNPVDKLRMVCVNFNKDKEQLFETSDGGEFPCTTQTRDGSMGIGNHTSHLSSLTSPFLYEPNASIMKAGCFAEVEKQFPIWQISANSHLFLSSVEIADFPGRKFQILAISSMNKQEIKCKFREIINQKLTSMESANIAVRNFPMTVDQLRKKLKLKDGGDTYIFATTLASGEHKILICRKIG